MMMGWIGLILIVVGIAALIAAKYVDRWASFEDGSFMGEILLFLIGGGSIVVGLILVIVKAALA